MMQKYILRFRGVGTKPEADVSLIQSLPNTTVLDATGRMLLVEAPAATLQAALESLPEWVMSEEQHLPLPTPRPAIRRRSLPDEEPR